MFHLGHQRIEQWTLAIIQNAKREGHLTRIELDPDRTDNLLDVPSNWNQMRYHCATSWGNCQRLFVRFAYGNNVLLFERLPTILQAILFCAYITSIHKHALEYSLCGHRLVRSASWSANLRILCNLDYRSTFHNLQVCPR